MLKVEINETTAKCVGAGGLDTITCEVALLINSLYNHIRRSNTGAAEAFRYTLVSLLTEDSTVWEEQSEPGTGFCIIVPKKNKGGL